jgi:hypothetical protein
MSSNKNNSLGQNARRELYLWAIFVDRFDLARYLCSKTWVRFLKNIPLFILDYVKNQSVAALIGARIYRLATQMAIHSEIKEEYEKNAE